MNNGKENKQKGRPKKNTDDRPYKNTAFCERLNVLFGNKESQESAANGIGVSRQIFGNWLLGNNMPSIQILVNIANYYKVSTDYLLGLSPNPTNNQNIDNACNITGLSVKSVERLSDWNEDNFKILDDLISTAKMNHITYLFDELQKASNLFIGKGIPYLNNIADMRNDETAKVLVSLIDKCDSITGKANKEFVKLLFLYDEREKNVSYNNIINELKLNGYIE